MMQRILVPLDGSTRAEYALPVAMRIARNTAGSIKLLRVVTTPIEAEPHALGRLTEKTLELDTKAATTYLDSLMGLYNWEGIEVEMKVLPGNAALTILDVAKEEHIDLIAMCSHGDTGFKRWFVGSVAQKVARHSPVPVLILRQESPLPLSSYPDRGRPLRTLMGLVALDGSALAEAALAPAASLVAALAAPARGTLLLTRVVPLPGDDNLRSHRVQSDPQIQKRAFDDAKEYLKKVVDQLDHSPVADYDLTIAWSIARGVDVADTLIRVAEQGEGIEEGNCMLGSCNLLALATHGRSGVPRLHM